METFRPAIIHIPSSITLILVILVALSTPSPAATAGRKLRKNSLLYFIETPFRINSLPNIAPRVSASLSRLASLSSTSSLPLFLSSTPSPSSLPPHPSSTGASSDASVRISNHLFTSEKKLMDVKAPLTGRISSSIYRLPIKYLSNAKPDRIISTGVRRKDKRKPSEAKRTSWIKSVESSNSLLQPSISSNSITDHSNIIRPERKESKIFQMPLKIPSNGKPSKMFLLKKSHKNKKLNHELKMTQSKQ